MMAFRTSPLWRLLIVLSLSALFALVLTSCGDSRITNQPEEPQPLRYQDEAEELALYVQGTLHPSEWLTKQISHELVLIRDTWGHSFPIVNRPFVPPWVPSEVQMRADSARFIAIMEGTDSDFQKILNELNVTVSDSGIEWFPRAFYTVATENLHPARLAEYFVGFPGIDYVETDPHSAPYHNYARAVRNDSVYYYFNKSICGYGGHAYYCFKVTNDSAIFIGRHAECWEGDYPTQIDSAFIGFLHAWKDSAEANRPEWVDDARFEIRDIFDIRHFFHWQRD